jgi:hypothetical protein
VLELDGTVSRGKDGDTVEANDEYDEQYSEWGQTDLMAAVAMPDQGHPSQGYGIQDVFVAHVPFCWTV